MVPEISIAIDSADIAEALDEANAALLRALTQTSAPYTAESTVDGMAYGYTGDQE